MWGDVGDERQKERERERARERERERGRERERERERERGQGGKGGYCLPSNKETEQRERAQRCELHAPSSSFLLLVWFLK